MNTTVDTPIRVARMSLRARKLRLAAFSAALLSAGIGNVQAQSVIEIGPNLWTNISNQLNTYSARFKDVSEYAKQAERWAQTAQHYKDMASDMQAKLTSFGLPQGVELKKVDESFMVAERCGGGSGDLGSTVSNALGSLVGVSMEGKIKQQQMQACVNAQRMRNRQYNEMVEYMQTTINKMHEASHEMDSIRTSSSKPGEMTNALEHIDRIGTQQDAASKEFDQRMTAYNTYIQAQDQTQQVLSQISLRGQPSITGQVIKTAALKAALSD